MCLCTGPVRWQAKRKLTILSCVNKMTLAHFRLGSFPSLAHKRLLGSFLESIPFFERMYDNSCCKHSGTLNLDRFPDLVLDWSCLFLVLVEGHSCSPESTGQSTTSDLVCFSRILVLSWAHWVLSQCTMQVQAIRKGLLGWNTVNMKLTLVTWTKCPAGVWHLTLAPCHQPWLLSLL